MLDTRDGLADELTRITDALDGLARPSRFRPGRERLEQLLNDAGAVMLALEQRRAAAARESAAALAEVPLSPAAARAAIELKAEETRVADQLVQLRRLTAEARLQWAAAG